MSGSLSTNYFVSANITSQSSTRITESMSRKVQRKNVGGQHWLITLDSKNLDRDENAELMAFLTKQQGQFDSFTIVPPIYGSTRSSNATGTPTVTQTYAAGLTSIRAQGGGGSLKTGDFIKFSNHDKIYMLTADINQDLSSEDYFEITPPLHTSITNSTTIQYNNVPFKVYLTDDRTGFKTNTDGTSRIQVSVREDI